jgi:hypothetical protein
MNQFKEAPNNPFDAPVPGQGLTDKPGNYPWEHPPQYTQYYGSYRICLG